MVVVSFDLRAVKLRRINRQRVAFLDHFRAAFGQFRPQRDDTLGFLKAQSAKVSKILQTGHFFVEWRDNDCGHDAVAQTSVP